MGELCYGCFKEKPYSGMCPFCGYDNESNVNKYPLALKEGSVLMGKYIVGRVLGQGGFGVTYAAQNHETKKMVAIKEYLPGEMATRTEKYRITAFSGQRLNDFQYGKECFLNEAKTIANFNGDQNIVQVYEYFEENNTAYFAMEYISGIDLRDFIISRGGKVSPEEAARILVPVMRAVNKIHEKGIVHRDIAPDNILIDREGRCAKLIDFGAARYSWGEKSMSLDVVLKHGFAPREQYSRRGHQGAYTDVYAMAATLYFMITGKVPPDSIDRELNDLIVLPSSMGIDISTEFEEALLKALEVHPEDRFQTMEEFAAALPVPASDADGWKKMVERSLNSAFQLLEAKQWDKADLLFEHLEGYDNPYVYIGRLMAQLHVEKMEFLALCKVPFGDNEFYHRAMQCADPLLRVRLEEYLRISKLNNVVSYTDESDTASDTANDDAETETQADSDADTVNDFDTGSDSGSNSGSGHKKAIIISAIAAIVAVIGIVVGLGLAGNDVGKTSDFVGGNSISASSTPVPVVALEPVYSRDLLEVSAKDDNKWNFAKLGLKLEPNQVYTLCIDEVEFTKGKSNIVGLRVFDFAKDSQRVLYTGLIDVSLSTTDRSCVFKTPANIGPEVDVALYSGIQGSTAGIGANYKGIKIYKGDQVNGSGTSNKGTLELMQPKLSIPANKDNAYNYQTMELALEPGQIYTLRFGNIKLTGGSALGISVKVNDFSKESGKGFVYSEVLPVNEDEQELSCRIVTPEDISDNTKILIYAGFHGATKGVGIEIENVRVYKGSN